jgi:hypothetical protein
VSIVIAIFYHFDHLGARPSYLWSDQNSSIEIQSNLIQIWQVSCQTACGICKIVETWMWNLLCCCSSWLCGQGWWHVDVLILPSIAALWQDVWCYAVHLR